jgi:hypothetical protein
VVELMDVFKTPTYKAAELLFKYEDTFQKIQSEYFRKLYEIGAKAPMAVVDIVQNLQLFVPHRDRARVLAIFYDDAGGIHIVWSDEYVPLDPIDKAYREIRKRVYGRTTDVESVHIVSDKVKFVTTYGPPNIYETSMHSDGEVKLSLPLTLYSWTWNHLMATIPSMDVIVKGGYYLARDYKIRKGTRDDAEAFAESV